MTKSSDTQVSLQPLERACPCLPPVANCLTDTHRGFHVTFHRSTTAPSAVSAGQPASFNRGFFVPSASEDDDSEMASDNDSDVEEQVGPMSSNKTTPEQVKTVFGSRERPINLENSRSPLAINLEEEEIEVIEDDDGDVGEDGDDATKPDHPAEEIIDSEDSDNEDENDDDEVGPMNFVVAGSDSGASDNLDNEIEDEVTFYPYNPSTQASDQEFDDLDSLEDGMEDCEGEFDIDPSMDGSDDGSLLAPANDDSDEESGPECVTSKMRASIPYDPVRGSQPPPVNEVRLNTEIQSSTTTGYTYAPTAYNVFADGTNVHTSTRWDVAPSSSLHAEAFPTDPNVSLFPLITAGFGKTPQFGAPTFHNPPMPVSVGRRDNFPFASQSSHWVADSQFYPQSQASLDPPNQSRPTGCDPSWSPPQKNKISINDILGDTNDEDQWTKELEELKETMNQVNAATKNEQIFGKKRKADEISDAEPVAEALPSEEFTEEQSMSRPQINDSTAPGPEQSITAATSETTVTEPARKKSKVATVAKETAKFVVGGIAGAVALGAFLISPYAAHLDPVQLVS